jgi:hypothetical protein
VQKELELTSVDYFIPDAGADTSSHVIAAYLDAYTGIDGLVVDPFCQSPTIVTEALESGRRVVAANFSPLYALRTRLALTSISLRDLDAAVTRLSDSPKLGVPLREHLQRLYRTECRHCGKEVIADYFIWERGQEVPKRVHYRCPGCGDAGVRDCDEADAHVLQEVKPRGLHYWYVLDRVARHEDEARKFAASLMELYTRRNLYVLYNLLLKTDDLFAGSLLHDFLWFALLHCLELGSKLNPVPGEAVPPSAPRLRPLPRFAEWNIWQLLEDATRAVGQRESVPSVALAAKVQDIIAAPLVAEAERPIEPAKAFVGHVSARQLVRELLPGSVSLVLTQPPQLGRSRWAMPFLWTGWLYGHEESALLWPLVRRRSSDWPWYLRAMRTTLSALRRTLTADGHIVFIGKDKGLAYHEALALAAAGANLRLESALYRPSEPEVATEPFSGLRGDYRLTWTSGPPTPPWPISTDELAMKVRQAAVGAAEEALQQRGEPVPFVRLHSNIWDALARQGLLQRVMFAEESLSPLHFVREQVRAALEGELEETLVQLVEDEEDGSCLWWLVQAPEVSPLSERVERVVCETLASDAPIGTTDFMRAVYKHFPGVLTPDTVWVMACLKSYGQTIAAEQWVLKEEDREEQRAVAWKMVIHLLKDLGQRLGYQVALGTQGFDVQWVGAEEDALAFAVLDSATLSRLLSLPPMDGYSPMRKLVIIPERRQDLLRLRLARSMWMRRQLAARGWQFVRDVDLQSWAGQEQVAIADLDSLVGLDPLSIHDRTQLSLI